MNLTSLSGIQRITQLSDPIERNIQITRSYHALSLEVSKRTGPCANWCTFATWASKQAGQTIRSEDLSKTLESKLATPELSQRISDIVNAVILKGSYMQKHAITALIWKLIDPEAAMRRASVAVARGNQKVYAEIAKEFARFIELCLPDARYHAEHIESFCASMKSGDPPDGQRFLEQAFRRYYQAFFEPDRKKKAELILLANLEIGFHEQSRLQPDIAEALEASVTDPMEFKQQLLQTLFPRQSWMSKIGSLFTRLTGRPSPLDNAINGFAQKARHEIRVFLTEHMMELGFPAGVRVQLGDDLTHSFPVALQHLTNADLIALLKQIDPTPDSLKESGAVDWAHLPDRLHFIADLFRCFQETSALLEQPVESGTASSMREIT